MTGTSPETMVDIVDALRLACTAADGVGAELYDDTDTLELGCDRLGVDMPSLWAEIDDNETRRTARNKARRAAVVQSRELRQPHLFDVLPGVTEAVVPLFMGEHFVGHVCVGPVVATGATEPDVPDEFADLTHMSMRQFSSFLSLVAKAVQPSLKRPPEKHGDRQQMLALEPAAGRSNRRISKSRPEQLVREMFVMARYGRVRDAVRAFSRERLGEEPVPEPTRSRILSDILLLADCCGKAGTPTADVVAWTRTATDGLQTAATDRSIEDIVSDLLGCVRRSGRSVSPRYAARLRRIAAHIETHLGDRLSAREIAGELGITSRQVVNCVRALTGISYVSFVTALRVARARKLLCDTQLTVAEISDRLGFSYESYFSRVFTRQVGEPPTRYRRRLKSLGQTVRQ